MEEKAHFSAEERTRAREAFALCDKLRHIGDDGIISALDNDCFTSTHLTSQDFRNARRLFGPCLACLEAKMKAPSEKPSLTPPAKTIGDRLHSDFIILKVKSLGGNHFILMTVDEKSTFIVAVPLKKKETRCVLEGSIETIVEFNAHGHKDHNITTDDETSLIAGKQAN